MLRRTCPRKEEVMPRRTVEQSSGTKIKLILIFDSSVDLYAPPSTRLMVGCNR
jgi:hypothetical protein